MSEDETSLGVELDLALSAMVPFEVCETRNLRKMHSMGGHRSAVVELGSDDNVLIRQAVWSGNPAIGE